MSQWKCVCVCVCVLIFLVVLCKLRRGHQLISNDGKRESLVWTCLQSAIDVGTPPPGRLIGQSTMEEVMTSCKVAVLVACSILLVGSRPRAFLLGSSVSSVILEGSVDDAAGIVGLERGEKEGGPGRLLRSVGR